ncbi:MAG: hypothetical protein KKB38_20480 [Gammaproteobacteria bacterium]|nr:hypothetical protein [Gammaproteobacteria bacterium]
MNIGKGYGWTSLSQWDIAPTDAHVERKTVETGLSKDICRFMLVNRVEQDGGYLRCEYVKKTDVTPEILEMAGDT